MKKSYSYEVLQEVSFDVDFKDLYETINQRISASNYKDILNEIEESIDCYISLEYDPQFIEDCESLYGKITEDFILCLKYWKAHIITEIEGWRIVNKGRSKEDFLDEQQMLNIPISFIIEITDKYF